METNLEHAIQCVRPHIQPKACVKTVASVSNVKRNVTVDKEEGQLGLVTITILADRIKRYPRIRKY